MRDTGPKLKNSSRRKKKMYLIRCPVCGLENYAPAVATGVCAWCRYNANKKQPTGRKKRA